LLLTTCVLINRCAPLCDAALLWQVYLLCLLQAGVGLWYAKQNGLDDMAAAYQRLLNALGPMDKSWFTQAKPDEEGQPAATAAGRKNEGADPGMPAPRHLWAAVFIRTWEVMQDQQQSCQTIDWTRSWVADEAAVSWVVDAAAFTAAGGVVVRPVVQPAVEVMAGGSACDGDSTQLQLLLPSAAAAGNSTNPSSTTAASTAAASSSGRSRRRPALALPPQVVCALDLLAVVLLHSSPAKEDMCSLAEVIEKQDVQLLEVMLLLGVPAHLQPTMDPSFCPLAMTILPFVPIDSKEDDRECDEDKAAVMVQVRVTKRALNTQSHVKFAHPWHCHSRHQGGPRW
jgi:hypothetical protein